MEKDHDLEDTVGATGDREEPPINPSGHRQELDRNFHLINICGLGLTSGNTWIAIGGSIVGFPLSALCSPDCLAHMQLYRWWQSIMADHQASYTNCTYVPFWTAATCTTAGECADLVTNRIASSVFYWLIAASLAELASAMPSSGGGAYCLALCDSISA